MNRSAELFIASDGTAQVRPASKRRRTREDVRAFWKRVLSRRAKKGYGCRVHTLHEIDK